MTEEKTKEALRALERILSYTNGLGDGEAYTIRATLTEATDVNAEMLEALRDAKSVISSINYKRTTPFLRDGGAFYGQTDEWCEWAENEILPVICQAIARAEAQKVGE